MCFFNIKAKNKVSKAVEIMAEHDAGSVVVLEGDRMVGIFTERDVIKRVLAQGLDPAKTPVSNVMTRDLVVAGPNDSSESCLKKMKQANCRHLPVVEGTAIHGIVSMRDLLQVELGSRDAQIEYLHEYLYQVPADTKRREKEEGG